MPIKCWESEGSGNNVKTYNCFSNEGCVVVTYIWEFLLMKARQCDAVMTFTSISSSV